MRIRANIWHLIGRLKQPAADGFLPLRAFKPSSSDSADRGRSIIQISKNVVVTATTGIASQGLRQKLPAISTIHKFVGSKDGRYENDELLNLIVHDENFVDIKNNIKAMDTLIIDEISMLSSKRFQHLYGLKLQLTYDVQIMNQRHFIGTITNSFMHHIHLCLCSWIRWLKFKPQLTIR